MQAEYPSSWRREEAECCFPLSLLARESACAVVRSGGPGLHDLQWHFGKAEIAEDAIFELGSLTKLFTSALLLEMALLGKLALEDRVALYLPEGIAAGSNVTWLDLATHRSGLPRLPSNIAPTPNPYASYTAKDLAQWIEQDGMRSTGTSPYLYSNLGYAVLGLALEGMSGLSYAALLQNYVLTPYGLTHTHLAMTQEGSHGCIQGYTEAGQKVSHWTWDAFAPCGGLVGTAKDVGLFLTRMHSDPKYAQMFQSLAPAGAGYIGLGWHLEEDQARVWHNGGTAGFCTFACIDLKSGKWFVVLINRFTFVVNSIGTSLGDLLFDGA